MLKKKWENVKNLWILTKLRVHLEVKIYLYNRKTDCKTVASSIFSV
nr:MAG TPA: hypothetical protein [Caudoviricetes sp.]